MAGTRGFGTTIAGATTTPIGKVRDVNGWGAKADKVDTTAGDNHARWKSAIAGAKEGKPITVTVLYTQAGFNTVLAAVGGDNELFTVTFPDGSKFTVGGFIDDCSGTSPMNGEIVFSFTIQPSVDAAADVPTSVVAA